MNTLAYKPGKDAEVTNPPADSVSSLNFGPNANQPYLVATSWDGKVRCWQVDLSTGQTQHMADQTHPQPVLCSTWAADGSKIFSGGCDKTLMQWDLGANAFTQVAAHDAPVSTARYVPEVSLMMTASWDKKIRYWDLRTATPVLEVPQPERVYDADVKYPLAVTALAERKIMVYDLRSPQKEHQTNTSALKFQSRCVAAFPSQGSSQGEGYALGSIEGRVAVRFPAYAEDAKDAPHFSFKCHREQPATTGSVQRSSAMLKVYSVNSIVFHPQYGITFATAGSDGIFNFWDRKHKKRLKALGPCKWSNGEPAPITCSTFNPTGTIYAYALSYDWSRGHEYYDRTIMKPAILLHGGCDVDLNPELPTQTNQR